MDIKHRAIRNIEIIISCALVVVGVLIIVIGNSRDTSAIKTMLLTGGGLTIGLGANRLLQYVVMRLNSDPENELRQEALQRAVREIRIYNRSDHLTSSHEPLPSLFYVIIETHAKDVGSFWRVIECDSSDKLGPNRYVFSAIYTVKHPNRQGEDVTYYFEVQIWGTVVMMMTSRVSDNPVKAKETAVAAVMPRGTTHDIAGGSLVHLDWDDNPNVSRVMYFDKLPDVSLSLPKPIEWSGGNAGKARWYHVTEESEKKAVEDLWTSVKEQTRLQYRGFAS